MPKNLVVVVVVVEVPQRHATPQARLLVVCNLALNIEHLRFIPDCLCSINNQSSVQQPTGNVVGSKYTGITRETKSEWNNENAKRSLACPATNERGGKRKEISCSTRLVPNRCPVLFCRSNIGEGWSGHQYFIRDIKTSHRVRRMHAEVAWSTEPARGLAVSHLQHKRNICVEGKTGNGFFIAGCIYVCLKKRNAISGNKALPKKLTCFLTSSPRKIFVTVESVV